MSVGWMGSCIDTDGRRQGTNKNGCDLEPFFSDLPWGELQASLSSKVLLLEDM